jgi:ATP-binding cassette subfamily C protein
MTRQSALFVAQVEARSARTIAELCLGGELGRSRQLSSEELKYAVQVGSPAAFNGLLNSVSALVAESTLFVFLAIGFLFLDPVVTFIALAYFGLIALAMQFFVGTLMSKAGIKSAEGAVAANTAITDLISVFRELLVLKKRGKYIEDIYNARLDAAKSAAANYYLSGMPRFIIEGALLVGIAIFVLGQSLSGNPLASAATIGVFLSGGFRLTAALLPLQNALLTLSYNIPPAKTAHAILQFAPKNLIEVTDDSFSMDSKHPPLGIFLEGVSLTYSDAETPALSEISFTIEPGSQVALMGPSGAGKSTLADLISGVMTPTIGQIRIIGDSESGESGRQRRISYVPQQPGLVSGSIRDNVALAIEPDRVNDADVIEALTLANLGDLIESLSEGINTSIGKLKDNLSGGQMQRLGLARALYSKPGLLIMDEATSALDAESEAEIQKILDAMRGEVTVVLIAHRINTIQHADKVIFLENGQVVDSGKFKELVSRNPSVERVVDLMRVEKD